MKRSSFLKSLLGIPAIAVLFPASPGAVAEDVRDYVSEHAFVSTDTLPQNPQYKPGKLVAIADNVPITLFFEECNFSLNDIIAPVNSEGCQLYVTRLQYLRGRKSVRVDLKQLTGTPNLIVSSNQFVPGVQYKVVGKLIHG